MSDTAPGLTPRGKSMPQTLEEWRYLAGLYEAEMLKDSKEISKLKQRINRLEQLSESLQRNFFNR